MMEMKRLTVILVTVMAMTTLGHAQFEIKFGGGLNFSTLTSPPEGTDVAANMGYQFGGGVLIGDKFYVEPGIQFLRNSKTITPETTDQFDFDQNFVKIPVYAGYHLLGHEQGPLALRVFAGPAVAIGGKIKKGEDQITKDDLSNALWMIDGGLGLDIFFLFVEASYEYSFNKYFEDDAFNSNHSGFLINAGIHIDF